jgi:predicted Zn-dependent protease
MFSKSEAFAILDRILAKCDRYYTIVGLGAGESGLTRFANSQIHQNVANENAGISITMYDGRKVSSMGLNAYDDASVDQAVAFAIENMRYATEEEMQLPEILEPKEIAGETFDPAIAADYSIPRRAELVRKAVERLDPAFTASGYVSMGSGVSAMGNNRGVRRFRRGDSAGYEIVVTHRDGASGYASMGSNLAADLKFEADFERAYGKARTSAGAASVEPGEYTVVLEPEPMAEMVRYINGGFSAKQVQKGESFLTGKIGTQVFGENFSLTDEPDHPDTVHYLYDAEGYPRTRLNLVENGVVKELAYDIKSAIKDGVKTTGHGSGNAAAGGFPGNLFMAGGTETMEGLIAGVKRGIYVTRFHYTNWIDRRQTVFTGLTRDGTYLIEDGKIVRPIRNLRFTQNITSALNHISGLTAERKKLGGVMHVPAARIEKFHFTGKTEL